VLLFVAVLAIGMVAPAQASELPPVLGGEQAYAPLHLPAVLFLFAIAMGFCTGLMTGAIGVGGGFVITPALMSVGISGILAVGTGMFYIFATAIMGTAIHKKLGNIAMPVAALFIAGSFAGVNSGAGVNKALYESNPLLSDTVITGLYVVLLGLVGAYTLYDFIRSGQREGPIEKESAAGLTGLALRVQRIKLPPMVHFDQKLGGRSVSAWLVVLCGFVVGFVASIMGVGGGFLTYPVYVYILGISPFTTVGTDTLQIIFTLSEAAIYTRALAALPGVGPRSVRRLLQAFPLPASFPPTAVAIGQAGLSARLQRALASLRPAGWEQQLREAARHLQRNWDAGVTPVPLADRSYPSLLRAIADPPPILYVRGRLPPEPLYHAVAIVGTRRPTPGGARLAAQVTRCLVAAGLPVVSGLARGIDTIAHQTALAERGWTIAVMGTPLDTIYPEENSPLASAILAQGGTWISELGVEERTSRAAFALRGRIQSGLSAGVIAVQTGGAGGTMHAARYAGQQGRLLFCPNPAGPEANLPQWTGIMQLIRTGKAVAFRVDDLPRISVRLRAHGARLLPPCRDGTSHQPVGQPGLPFDCC
jgi:DNA protecting protein DprA